MPELLLVPAVHVVSEPGGLRVDDKFLSGLAAHRDAWDGKMRVLLREGRGALPFSRVVAPADIPGEALVLPDGAAFGPVELAGADVILASGDMHDQLALPAVVRAVGARLVYAVEYTLATRLRTAALDPGRSPAGRARSALWLLAQERRRRRAFREADALQFNGYPAARAYGRLDPEGCLYLDGRLRAADMATAAEMEARRARAAAGAPLRLLHSGRLEPMKGAQDLVPFARALAATGTKFTLDIYGAGSLVPAIGEAIAAAGLGERVRLHRPVDFETALVPTMRREADLFLSLHRQGDPSCSYLEAMGCGLPVLGTANEMWAEMARSSGGGWAGPAGRPAALAARLAALAAEPGAIAAAAGRALAFARAHAFEAEFARRMAHLAAVAARA